MADRFVAGPNEPHVEPNLVMSVVSTSAAPNDRHGSGPAGQLGWGHSLSYRPTHSLFPVA